MQKSSRGSQNGYYHRHHLFSIMKLFPFGHANFYTFQVLVPRSQVVGKLMQFISIVRLANVPHLFASRSIMTEDKCCRRGENRGVDWKMQQFLNCHKKLLLIFPVLYATTPLMLLLHYQPTSWMKTPFIGNTGGLPRLGAVSTACPLISTWKERWIRHCVTVFRKVSVGFRKYFNFLKLLRWAKLVNWGWDLWCRTTCYSK